jgi:hypothetical protein
MSVDTETLSCRELVELVTDYLEGALGPADHARFGATRRLRTCTAYRAAAPGDPRHGR